MKNRRKGMILVSMWLMPHEEKELDKFLKKPIKKESDLTQIGDIIGTISARGDFKR